MALIPRPDNKDTNQEKDIPKAQPTLSEAVAKLPEHIKFPTHTAQVLPAGVAADPETLVDALHIKEPPKALITVSGGAGGLDESLMSRLEQLCSRGIARTASEMGADIIDGGTNSGVMSLMGRGVADRGRRSNLIGIAPASRVSCGNALPIPENDTEERFELEPNHSHFVLVDTPDWGKEADVRQGIAQTLVTRYQIPAITLLFNGGPHSCTEILQSVRAGWPVIVITGSGRAADEIHSLHEAHKEHSYIDDPVMAEIITDGRLYFFPIDGAVAELERMIRRLLRGDITLRQAWERFAVYDANANRHQQHFRTAQMWILILGVLGTFLALTQATIESQLLLANAAKDTSSDISIIQKFLNDFFNAYRPYFEEFQDILQNTIIIIPVLITGIMAVSNRFNPSAKWLWLRGSAEAIKREIFRYRADAEIYAPEQCLDPETSREVKLAEKLQNISSHVMQTEVNTSALQTYDGPIPPQWSTAPGDDGFSRLTPEQYLTYRVEDQYKYYVKKTNDYDRKLRRLQILIYVIGGIGTLLAALSLELWIALTAALVTALTNYLGYQQLESSLLQYNQASTDLSNVRNWWVALSASGQEKQSNINLLVGQTERILHSEFSNWMQEMQEALTELREEQEREVENADNQLSAAHAAAEKGRPASQRRKRISSESEEHPSQIEPEAFVESPAVVTAPPAQPTRAASVKSAMPMMETSTSTTLVDLAKAEEGSGNG